MTRPMELRMIERTEIIRDLINWLDYTDAGWRTREPTAKLDLLTRGHRYFEQVARSHRIPESDFQSPLCDAVMSIRQGPSS